MRKKIQPAALRGFTEKIFEAAGAEPEEAAIAAGALIEANLCGVDSHGIRMLPGLVKLIRNGKINPKGQIEILKETPVIAHLDAGLALGSVVGVRSMRMAAQKAKVSGVGFVLVRNSTHWGRAANYAAIAAREGCFGVCFANTESNMPIWGAKKPSIGNNPMAVAAPRGSGEPVVLDMAMSQAAFFKIVLQQREGRKVPFGWGVDEQGNPTDDPAAIIKSRRLVPMGQHKGSGLAFMIDVLTGILSGGRFCGELLEKAKEMPHATSYSQAFLAIDIETFMPLEAFERRVDELVEYVKSAPLAEGFSEINIPGERAWRERTLRERDGIPLDDVTFGELQALGEELRIPFPG